MIGQCLDAINASNPRPKEIIVFDDGSTDRTAEIARAKGAHVITAASNAGPAVGRNTGVEAASTDVVIFVDADVVVEPDALGRLASTISDNEDVVAAFGSYTEYSSVRNFAGRYANLRHHHVHQQAAPNGKPVDAQTFWSGLGAVDRRAFLAVGGFDTNFDRPSIEDVELGLRLRQNGGRILLNPRAHGEHLKNWTVRCLWRTDIKLRAIPWSELIAEGRIDPTLNTSGSEKGKAVIAILLLVSLGLSILLMSLPLATMAGVLGLLYLWVNRDFLKLLANKSRRLALAGAGFHWLYHIYASVTFVAVMAFKRFAPGADRASSRQGIPVRAR